ncbi:MAG: hypothetical protein AAGI23_18215 [Bacteroidota bacterium]
MIKMLKYVFLPSEKLCSQYVPELSFIFIRFDEIPPMIYKLMKLLLDIKDSEARSVLQLSQEISLVKVKQLTDEKAQLMSEIREAVENLKSVRASSMQARSAKDLLQYVSE